MSMMLNQGNEAHEISQQHCGKAFDANIDQKHQTQVEIKTTLISRNITVDQKRTSVRLEPEMWNSLYDIANREGCSIHDICTLINLRKNPKTSLTAAIRVFLMLYFRAASTEDGHARAGHGNFAYMRYRAGIAERPSQVKRKELAH